MWKLFAPALLALLSFGTPAGAGVLFDGTTYLQASTGGSAGLQVPSTTTSQRGIACYWYNSTHLPPGGASQVILGMHNTGSSSYRTSSVLFYLTHQNVGVMYATLGLTGAPGVNAFGPQIFAQNKAQPLPYDGKWHTVCWAWDLSTTPRTIESAVDAVKSNNVVIQYGGSGTLSSMNWNNTTWWIGTTPYLPTPGIIPPLGADVGYVGGLDMPFVLLYDTPFIDLFRTQTPGGTYAATWVTNSQPCLGPRFIGLRGEYISGNPPTVFLDHYTGFLLSLFGVLGDPFAYNHGFPFAQVKGPLWNQQTVHLPTFPTIPWGCGPHS